MRLILIISSLPHNRPSPATLGAAVEPDNRMVPLESLRAGQSARVGRVLGQPDHVHRLEEFGLRRGTLVEMFRPGNPCILRLGGNKVCLRVGERLNVLVQPADSLG